MKDTTKVALCQELKGLLAEWDKVLQAQAAIDRDYERLKARIISICNDLDRLDGEVK